MILKFDLDSTNGGKSKLEDYKGKYLVLYFYPKDNTSGCTIEANEFSELNDEFLKNDAIIVGISKDKLSSHKRFIDKESIPFELLSDPDREVHANYDVLKAGKMFGRDVIKTIRSTFVFDKDSKLIKEYRKVKSQGHAKEVLEFIKSL